MDTYGCYNNNVPRNQLLLFLLYLVLLLYFISVFVNHNVNTEFLIKTHTNDK